MSVITVSALLADLKVASSSERDKGDRFEKLVQRWLQTEPLYAGRFDEVWSWMDWPERVNRPDHGIDLVARERETGDLVAIQCKFYEPTHYLTKPDIDSFLSESGKYPFKSRLVVSTTDRWNSAAQAAVQNQQIPVSRIGWADLLESSVDWSQFSFATPQVLVTKERSKIRPYQRTAIDKVAAGFVELDRGQLIMACGTGKTFTSLQIAQEHVGAGGAVLFLVPSIALLSQSLKAWSGQADVPLRTFAVCSDVKVGKTQEDMTVVDLALPATTSPEKLADRAAATVRPEAMTVVFATYQSIDVVARAQTNYRLPAFDLVICDEAHRTTGAKLVDEDESAFMRVHDAGCLSAVKRLYMTATPRIYDDNTKAKGKEANAVLASMDDHDTFGPEFYRLGFGEAVSGGWLTDYKVLVLTVDEGAVSRTFQRNLESDGELQLPDVARMVGCWNALAKRVGTSESFAADPQPMRRAVAFAQNIRMSKRFADAFEGVVNTYRDVLAETGNLDGDELPLLGSVQHVDGTMNMLQRGRLLDWLKADAPDDEAGAPQARILSNAKCLSEGVDVPSLDAVMFLHPRKSVVDVVQSVGRVMRLATGKKYGYIILPIAVPAGMPPEEALADNKRFQVVWEVLQALRAHDERFDATINMIDLNRNRPDSIDVFHTGPATDSDVEANPASGDLKTETRSVQLALTELDEWRDAVFAKIVAKVGSRRYWETWAKDVADIVERHTTRLRTLLANPPEAAITDLFTDFVNALRANLNDSITNDAAIDMLSQHLVTKPVFDALFPGHAFTSRNPVAQVMQSMLEILEGSNLEAETQSLEGFYDSVRVRAAGIDNAAGKQKVITELYEQFFKTAFPRQADALGIVYTPVEIVDFILRSVNDLLHTEFGTSLSGKDVHVLDPFAGTGTFITRLLADPNLLPQKDLTRKYTSELHANEITLLAYYIAAANIEATYADRVTPDGHTLDGGAWEPFDGIVLADTFHMTEADDSLDRAVFHANNQRAERQLGLPITAIVGNPPYSSGQDSANDGNQNEAYPSLDAAIRSDFSADRGRGGNTSLYDSYIRAIKWASLRISGRGIIGFVTNGGFLRSSVGTEMRRALSTEFSSIYLYDLRGYGLVGGEEGRREGRPLFEFGGWRPDGTEIKNAKGGSRTAIVIVLFIKNPAGTKRPGIYYAKVADYLTAGQKIRAVAAVGSISGLHMDEITPDKHSDWLDHRTDDFADYMPLGAKHGEDAEGAKVFDLYGRGLETGRDAWVYQSSQRKLQQQVQRTIDAYNEQVEDFTQILATNQLSGPAAKKRLVADFIDLDPTRISWTLSLKSRLASLRPLPFDAAKIVPATYRPFYRQNAYFDAGLNHIRGQSPRFFPTEQHSNFGFVVTGVSSHAPFGVIMVDSLPDLHVLDTGQFFGRYRYEEAVAAASDHSLFNHDHGATSEGGYRRIDNITDAALQAFVVAYGDHVTKDDVFFYVYGLLHSVDYRSIYGADLKKTLPRTPLAIDPWPFIEAGRALSALHRGYETAAPYALDGLDTDAIGDPYEFFRVTRIAFLRKRVGGKSVEDKTVIIYNSRITLSGIPDSAYRYMLGTRSAIDWLLERWRVTRDKTSGIVNDPNDWSREVGNPRYIIDLLARVVSVSVETTRIIESLPPLTIRHGL